MLHTFLYVGSITILLIFIVPSLLSQAQVVTLFYFFSLTIDTQRVRFGFKRRKRSETMISSVALVMTFVLGIVSIIYCIVEFSVFHRAFFEANDEQNDAKTNSILAAIMIFLEIGFLNQLRRNGQFSWTKMPKLLSGLHRLAMIHLMITNIATWLKILTKETVAYTLEYHNVSKTSTEVITKNYTGLDKIPTTLNYTNTTVNIPPYPDPLSGSDQAYKCLKNESEDCITRNTLWTMEQGFTSDPYGHHFGINFYPFFNEFCLLMACVFYEMFSTENPAKDGDVKKRNSFEDDQDNETGNFVSITKPEKKLYTQIFSPLPISCGKLLTLALAFFLVID